MKLMMKLLKKYGFAPTRIVTDRLRVHIHYGLFAAILNDLAQTTKAIPIDDEVHRTSLAEAALALHEALNERGGPEVQ